MINDKIEEALKDFRSGRMLIVVDDEKRENEADLVMAGEKANNAKINFMAKEGRGLICAPISSKIALKLALPQMTASSFDKFKTAFTISLDVKEGTTTGISALDRSKTIKKLCDPEAKKEDFYFPGHVFPLRAEKQGVLIRPGHTEAAIDLCKIARMKEVAVICEIMNDDGNTAQKNQLQSFAKKHGLKIITISDLILYRKKTERLAICFSKANLPTEFGEFKIMIFNSKIDKSQHLALVKGSVSNQENVLTRIHSECLTGDALFSKKCDCGEQLRRSFEIISKKKKGVIIYLRQEGRGIGLQNKIKAYALQEKGYDTVEANEKLGFAPDLREYSLAASILKELNVKSVNLLTNNPKKINELEIFGIKVDRRIALKTKATFENLNYLETKIKKMGHFDNHLND